MANILDSKQNLLTTKEAASFLNVSEASIRRWTDSGDIKCYRIGKRKIRRIPRDTLLEYLRKSESKRQRNEVF